MFKCACYPLPTAPAALGVNGAPMTPEDDTAAEAAAERGCLNVALFIGALIAGAAVAAPIAAPAEGAVVPPLRSS